MITHVLLMKAREDLTHEERRELENAVESLSSLPGVQNMSWGPDFSGRGKGFTHGAVMYFADRDALAAYQQNEQHRAVVAVLDRVLSEKLVVDYETGSSGISA